MTINLSLIVIACMVVFCFLGVCQGGGLRKNFYIDTCPQAEDIVNTITREHVLARPELPAKLLRIQFHDCFVRGCDASVMLQSGTANGPSEKQSIPNLTLTAGFDVIDAIKEALEAQCPGTVSCADIIALAARDAVSVQFNRHMWEVPTGRRDGTISNGFDVLANIPAPFLNFTQLLQNFHSKNLTLQDLVVLSGAHTLGVGHCNLIHSRIYNFTGKGDHDPSLNSTYVEYLKTKCNQSLDDRTTTVDMDPSSSTTFDSSYYSMLLQNKGMFQSDVALLATRHSRKLVNELVDQNTFFKQFARSMKRLGSIKVLTGTAGEIRRNCSDVNS